MIWKMIQLFKKCGNSLEETKCLPKKLSTSIQMSIQIRINKKENNKCQLDLCFIKFLQYINRLSEENFMHLIAKNFGKSPAQSNSLSSKGGYFSSLNLNSLSVQQPQNSSKAGKKSEKRKGPPKGFIPEKFALAFDPPCIILQYRDPQNKKLYHHKMPIKKLAKETPVADVLYYLRKKHQNYFSPKVIDETQIQKLIQKLKLGLGTNNKSIQDIQQDDFDFDYDEDFED